jgi:hypothetical protein
MLIEHFYNMFHEESLPIKSVCEKTFILLLSNIEKHLQKKEELKSS